MRDGFDGSQTSHVGFASRLIRRLTDDVVVPGMPVLLAGYDDATAQIEGGQNQCGD
jgi:hypothetical protein